MLVDANQAKQTDYFHHDGVMGSDARYPRSWISWATTWIRSRNTLTVFLSLTVASIVSYVVFRRWTSPIVDRGFSWLSYIQLNPDLRHVTYEYATTNFAAFGKKRGRPYIEPAPEMLSMHNLWKQLNHYTSEVCNSRKPYEPAKNNLIIYHIPKYDAILAKVTMLNLHLFLSSIPRDPCQSEGAFYVFSIEEGEESEYSKAIPTDLPHVFSLHWHESVELDERYQQLRTLEEIGLGRIGKFGAVFLLNINTRGPLTARTDNQWISAYRALLDGNRVGMVSPVGCDEVPLLLPRRHHYAAAFSAAYIEELLREFETIKYQASEPQGTYNSEMDRLLGYGADSVLARSGFKYASIVQHRVAGTQHYAHSCPAINSQLAASERGRVPLNVDPRWCRMRFDQQVFVLWGSDWLTADEYQCANIRHQMRTYLSEFAHNYPDQGKWIEDRLGPIDAFEMRYDTAARELMEQHVQEEKREFLALKQLSGGTSDQSSGQSSTSAAQSRGGKVCFLVRTAAMHDAAPASPLEQQRVYFSDSDSDSFGGAGPSGLGRYSYTEVDLLGFIRSLLKQTDPNWVAHFFLTDNKSFPRLETILTQFNDPRLRYLDLPRQFRPPFTKIDGGYTATDYVLKQLLADQGCDWLSATNGDNLYGSEVVERVRRYGRGRGGVPGSDTDAETGAGVSGDRPSAQMLLAPLDSRNFPAKDYFLRYGFITAAQNGCQGINAMVHLNQLAFTAQPMPVLARVDLAALFLHRESLARANLLFANFTDPRRYPCQGCQDGYLAETLIRRLGWRYERLPLDGLKSIVFHGPSPTLCIASGNVWYDYPAVNKLGCLTRQTVHALRVADALLPSGRRQFDWADHDAQLGVCLRLSEHGFSRIPLRDTFLESPPTKMLQRLNGGFGKAVWDALGLG